jgi:hypothetical protein
VNKGEMKENGFYGLERHYDMLIKEMISHGN